MNNHVLKAKTDDRTFELVSNQYWRPKIYAVFTQLELLKIIKCCKHAHASYLSDRIEKIIKRVDIETGEVTDFIRPLPKKVLTHD